MNVRSGSRMDFIPRYLYAKISNPHGVLNNIEQEDKIKINGDYIYESIKEMEENLRYTRGLCVSD
jgi:hypothetical protein